MLKGQIFKDLMSQCKAERTLKFRQIKDKTELLTTSNMASSQDGKSFEAVASYEKRFLKKNMNLLEVTCHEIFPLHSSAF